MNIIKNARVRVASAIAPTQNSFGGPLPLSKQFLRYGNRKPMIQDWSQVVMNDEDMYTGYPYAAIRNKANRVAWLARNYIRTSAKKEILKQAKDKDEVVNHPYLDLIDQSKTFANRTLWYNISTYLDLEGVYYLMVIRAVNGTRVGNIQEFKMLNPFNMRRIVKEGTFEIGGYVETRKGYIREFPPEMIIDIRELNPFDEDEPFGMADAARESQFTLKQAGDYTRHTLKGNMAAPGIIGTDVILPEGEFNNFVDRVTNQEKGTPLFGNGAGAITWQSMQVDMEKASLHRVNNMSRDSLFAVSGASKTSMGIEESGTTRETSKVQRDLHTEDHALPRLELILDAFNQDFKTHYESEYLKSKYEMYVDNPLGSDHEAELSDTQVREKQFDIFTALVNKGYDRERAAKYAAGEIGLDELGEPDPAKVVGPPVVVSSAEGEDDEGAEQAHDHDHEDIFALITNQFDEQQLGLVNQQQAALQNAVINIEERLVGAVMNKVSKNAFDTAGDIINRSDRKEAENELEIALAAFFGIIIPLYGRTTMDRRAKEFGQFASFKFNNEVKRYIKKTASKAAQGHIETILEDILVEVRRQALEGASQQEIISSIRKKYTDIAKNRAKTIARTETNRAFTRAQFEADLQFIKENKLEGRAYKKWITRSNNPCPICVEQSRQPPIPFDTNFADLGDVLSATYIEDGKTKVRKQTIGFEDVKAGNMHPNCSCAYQLIIE